MSKPVLDKHEFLRLAKELAEFSDDHHFNWRLDQSAVSVTPFLVFKQRLNSSENKDGNLFAAASVPATDEGKYPEFECDQATLTTARCDIVSMEYHVVYSESYQVPVLYLNAFHSDGKLLTLDEIWDNVPSLHQKRVRHDRWTVITQQEHPVLGRPFFQLHPCHTEDLMQQVLPRGSKGNYIVTWLSSVGPLVGLHLPLSFSQLCGRDG